ncbi:TPA: hypothetical protein QCH64_001612 [Enterobacter asburiae]|uniref:hypothetical protein n=1 Tax=Enterobacter asburiae TaxID=61645 RepID=UPI0021624E2E|nr:hypothetical protein [Enterobacter asburiae]MCS0624182.1 hypothetical protein [Enterobacter asburiae]HDR2363360.1 hypothetical protein [Enterobacter asburiae]
MLDISPLLHAVIAVVIQVTSGFLLGEWAAGGAIGCMWFIAREHTQAEYRWIAKFGAGKRANMPWWGGFSWRAWNLPSLLDWFVPVLACAVVYFVATL